MANKTQVHIERSNFQHWTGKKKNVHKALFFTVSGRHFMVSEDLIDYKFKKPFDVLSDTVHLHKANLTDEELGGKYLYHLTAQEFELGKVIFHGDELKENFRETKYV